MKRLIFLLFSLVFTSCVTSRVNQFASFADAGKLYLTAVDGLLQETGRVAIDTDSEILLKDRDLFNQEERGDLYLERAEVLREYLATLQDLQRHTSLLGDYFTALGQLAGTEAPSSLGDRMNAVMKSLESLHPRLKEASFDSGAAKDFMGASVPLAIASFRNQKLEAELRRNAPLIERELELQQAMVTALAGQLRFDLELLLGQKDYNQVMMPYVNPGMIGEPWKAKRREVMTTYLSLDAVNKAVAAAGALKRSFLDLVENRMGSAGFQPLFGDIDAMISLVEMLRKKAE